MGGARLVCARQGPEGRGWGLSLPFSLRNDALLGLSSTPKPLCQLQGSLRVNDLLNHPARKLGNSGGLECTRVLPSLAGHRAH